MESSGDRSRLQFSELVARTLVSAASALMPTQYCIAITRVEMSLRTPDVKEIEVSRFLHGVVGLKPSAG